MAARTDQTTGKGQRGATLIEIVVVLAIVGIIMAPMAGILNRFVFLPARWEDQLALVASARETARWVAADARQAETFTASTNPDYGTFTWVERTGEATSTVSVVYTWNETSTSLMREETFGGELNSRTISESISAYEDVVISESGSIVTVALTSTRDQFFDTVTSTASTSAKQRTSAPTPQATPLPFRLAWDNLETGNASGGTGWESSWSLVGSADITTANTPVQQGIYHLRMEGHASQPGSAERTVNLSGLTGVRLQYYAKVDGFEAGDTVELRVSPDGDFVSNFTTIRIWTDAASNDTYFVYDDSLSASEPFVGTEFFIGFFSFANSGNDEFFIDDFEVVRTWSE